jgi:hypothetical protein
MNQRLFVVESVFTIKGLDLGAVGFKADDYGSLRTRIGEEVELRKPDGSSRHAPIVGVEYPPSIKRIDPKPPDPRYGIILANLTAADMSPGTEIWTTQ